VIAVTHDRYFLDNVVGWILEIDNSRAYPFKGNYESWLEAKSARLDTLKVYACCVFPLLSAPLWSYLLLMG